MNPLPHLIGRVGAAKAADRLFGAARGSAPLAFSAGNRYKPGP